MRSEQQVVERMAELQDRLNKLGNTSKINRNYWVHLFDRITELEWVLMVDDIEFPPERVYPDQGGL